MTSLVPKDPHPEILPDMPTELKAKLEFSAAGQLFRIALDLRLQYQVMIDAAYEDFYPVAEWFAQTKQFDEGINWLYANSPDCVPRVLTINKLINAKYAYMAEQKEISRDNRDPED